MTSLSILVVTDAVISFAWLGPRFHPQIHCEGPEIQVVCWEEKSIWSFESWNLNYQRSNCYSGKMSASGRWFHDFAVENCQPRVLIIWLNVSAPKYKVRRWPKLFLFQGREEIFKNKNHIFLEKKIKISSDSVFLSRGQISVSHSDVLWNNNVVLNGFVIYSNSCPCSFLGIHFISSPPLLPQMSQSNVQMLPCPQYKQMLVKFVIMQWNGREWKTEFT